MEPTKICPQNRILNAANFDPKFGIQILRLVYDVLVDGGCLTTKFFYNLTALFLNSLPFLPLTLVYSTLLLARTLILCLVFVVVVLFVLSFCCCFIVPGYLCWRALGHFNQLPCADKAPAQEERGENADRHIYYRLGVLRTPWLSSQVVGLGSGNISFFGKDVKKNDFDSVQVW